MLAKFTITLEDGSEHMSHDDNWKPLKDHAHFLAPNNEKKWVKYKLEGTNGAKAEVDFKTGVIRLNDSTVIHPANKEDIVLTGKDQAQQFPVTKEWQILNGLPYFPVVGRRMYKGFDIDVTMYFCGWKRKVGKRTIQKLVYLLPNGEFVLN